MYTVHLHGNSGIDGDAALRSIEELLDGFDAGFDEADEPVFDDESLDD